MRWFLGWFAGKSLGCFSALLFGKCCQVQTPPTSRIPAPSIGTLIHKHSKSFFHQISQWLDTSTQFFPISLLKIFHNQCLVHSSGQSLEQDPPKKASVQAFFSGKKIKNLDKKKFFHFLQHQAPTEHLWTWNQFIFQDWDFSRGKCFSLCCYVTLDHPPSSFPPFPDNPKKRSCEPLFFLDWGLLFLFPVPSTSYSLESARFAVIWDSHSKSLSRHWQRLSVTRTALLGGDPLAWAGVFNPPDSRILGSIS